MAEIIKALSEYLLTPFIVLGALVFLYRVLSKNAEDHKEFRTDINWIKDTLKRIEDKLPN